MNVETARLRAKLNWQLHEQYLAHMQTLSDQVGVLAALHHDATQQFWNSTSPRRRLLAHQEMRVLLRIAEGLEAQRKREHDYATWHYTNILCPVVTNYNTLASEEATT